MPGACRRMDVERDLPAFQRFLDDHIFGVPDFGAYIQKCGGLPRLQELRLQELLLANGA